MVHPGVKPHSLSTTTAIIPETPPSPMVARFGHFPKGTILPETIVPHSPRRRLSDFPAGFIPPRFYERNLEQNQQVSSCCRHVEDHDIEAFKSHPDEPAPDVYVIYCGTCGRKHRRLCVGTGPRPEWR